jgi:hypothetical protein
VFTPHGRLRLIQTDDAPLLEATTAERLQKAFARASAKNLRSAPAKKKPADEPPAPARTPAKKSRTKPLTPIEPVKARAPKACAK